MTSKELVSHTQQEIEICEGTEMVHGLFDRAFSSMEAAMQKYANYEFERQDLIDIWSPFAQKFLQFLERHYEMLNVIGITIPYSIFYGKEYKKGDIWCFFEKINGSLDYNPDELWIVFRSPIGNAEFRMSSTEAIVFTGTTLDSGISSRINNINMFSDNANRKIEIGVKDSVVSMTHTVMMAREDEKKSSFVPILITGKRLSFW